MIWKVTAKRPPSALQSDVTHFKQRLHKICEANRDWATAVTALGKGNYKCITNQMIRCQSTHWRSKDDFAGKGPYGQSYGFSRRHVRMWKLNHKESWVLKNWCFWTVVLEKTLQSPWTAGRSNQSILKEISPEYSLVGLMLMLTLQQFGQLMQRTDSLEKTLILGKTEGGRRRGWQDDIVGWHHQLNGHEFE